MRSARNVVAVDIADDKLALASRLGAVATVNANAVADPAEAVIGITRGGAHVSLDALGHPETCFNSISCLRRRGRHIQVGLMLADHGLPSVPMGRVIAHELEILGSHGMQAHRYDAMLAMIAFGQIAAREAGRRTDRSCPVDRGADDHGHVQLGRRHRRDLVLKGGGMKRRLEPAPDILRPMLDERWTSGG